MINEAAYTLGSKRSYIRELFEFGMAQAKVVGRENVFDYSIGNPSIPAPVYEEALRAALDEQDFLTSHGYTSAAGNDVVRAAVSANLTRRFGMTIRPENLFFTCGAAPALIAAIRALRQSEETEIVAIAPYFAEYRPFVEGNACRFVEVPADTPAMQINIPALKERLTPNTQAVIVNSPNNPSGVIYSRETLTELAKVLTAKAEEFGHPIYILADEPYRELAYDGTEVPFIPAIYPDTVICYSWSKSLSIPGDRIGYACVPDCATDGPRLFAAIAGASRVMGHVCPPAIVQHAVARCCEAEPDLEIYDTNRKLLYENLTAYGYECVKPQGAFYMFVKAPGGDAVAFSEKAKKYNLLVVPSDSFGLPGYFRVSYCVSTEMIRRSLPAFEALIGEGSRG